MLIEHRQGNHSMIDESDIHKMLKPIGGPVTFRYPNDERDKREC